MVLYSFFADMFNITEVALHTGEIKDSDYYMSAENMDAVSSTLLFSP